MASMKERYEQIRLRQKNHEGYDSTETWRMMKALADEGYAPAQCNQAIACYSIASQLPESFADKKEEMLDECKSYIDKAIAQNDDMAIAQMGVWYYNGDGPVDKQSHTKAFEYYERAAELGNKIALCNMACMIEEGEGCEQDISKAASIYRELTSIPGDDFDADAAYNLGFLCITGKLGDSDRVKAEGMVVLREAAYDHGHRAARELLTEYTNALKK